MLRSNTSIHRAHTPLLAIVPIAAWFVPALRAQPASFQGLGALSGMGESYAVAISANGSTVIGNSGSQGFRWTAGAGMLGYGSAGFQPTAVSADGSMVVGYMGGFQRTEAARWTADAGVVPQGFGQAGYSDYSRASGVAADGQVMVGQASRLTNECCEFFGNPCGYHVARTRAFTQRAPGAPLRVLGPLQGYSSSSANSVSSDGSTVIGVSFDESCGSGSPWDACIWIGEAAPIGLGFLPGQTASTPYAVSSNGSTVVGSSSIGYGPSRAFRWTASTGMTDLGQLFSDSTSNFAYAVSADGSVVIGHSAAAFIWDPVHGMRDLSAVLTGLGLDLSGWTSLSARGISADGRTIAGSGLNPAGRGEAWIAFLGDPLTPPCPGDVNDDRAVDLTDLATLLAHFGATCDPPPCAYADGDLDSSGHVDLADLAALLASFGSTCP